MFDVKDLVIPFVTDKLLVVAKIKHSHACRGCQSLLLKHALLETVVLCMVCAHYNCMAGLSEA